MSSVTCHVSGVNYHLSHVMCHMSHFFFSDKVVKPIGGGSVINGATPSSFMYKSPLLQKNLVIQVFIKFLTHDLEQIF